MKKRIFVLALPLVFGAVFFLLLETGKLRIDASGGVPKISFGGSGELTQEELQEWAAGFEELRHQLPKKEEPEDKSRSGRQIQVGEFEGSVTATIDGDINTYSRPFESNPSGQEESEVTALEPERPLPKAKSLAVLGFQGLPEELEDRLEVQLLKNLSIASELEIVDRISIDAILSEIELNLSGAIDPAKTMQLGQLVNADWLVNGSIFQGEDNQNLLVKLLDARTGVVVDVSLLDFSEDDVEVAATEICDRIVQAHSGVNLRGQTVKYVAIGDFRDMSFSDGFESIGDDLKTFLETSAVGSGLQLVERTLVSPLFDELQMQQMGLLQSQYDSSVRPGAFLFVDGLYQVYYQGDQMVSLVLRVKQIGGPLHTISIKKPLGQELQNSALSFIQNAVENLGEDTPLPKNRETEIAALVERAREIEQSGVTIRDHTEHKRRMESAIELYKSALLLHPESFDLKLRLGGVYSSWSIGRKEEARALAQEVMVAAAGTQFERKAIQLFRSSYHEPDLGLGPRENSFHYSLEYGLFALKLQKEEHQTIKNDMELYGSATGIYGIAATLKDDGLIDFDEFSRHALFSLRVLSDLDERNIQNGTKNYTLKVLGSTIFNGISHRGTSSELVNFYDRLMDEYEREFPSVFPYFLIEAATIQVNPSAPVFEKLNVLLDEFLEDRSTVWNPELFQGQLASLMQDAWKHNNLALAERVGKYMYENGQFAKDPRVQLLNLAKIQMRQSKWGEAMKTLESVGLEPISMYSSNPVSVLELYNICRIQLGMEEVGTATDSFALGSPFASVSSGTMIDANSEFLWIASGDSLYRFEDVREQPLKVELDRYLWGATSMVSLERKVWIGFEETGLVEIDTESQKVTSFDVDEGLAMSGISSLFVDGERLWIGYRTKNARGIGFMNLETHEFTADIPERISDNSITKKFLYREENVPPLGSIMFIRRFHPNEISIYQPGYYSRFIVDELKWATREFDEFSAPYYLAMVGDENIGARAWRENRMQYESKRGIDIVKNGELLHRIEGQHFGAAGINALAIGKNRLWAGGNKFLGSFNLDDYQLEDRSTINDMTIDQLCVFGPYLVILAESGLWLLNEDKPEEQINIERPLRL